MRPRAPRAPARPRPRPGDGAKAAFVRRAKRTPLSRHPARRARNAPPGRAGSPGHDRRPRAHRNLAPPRPAHPAPGQGRRGARLRRDLDRRLPARRPVPRPGAARRHRRTSPSPPASSTCGRPRPPRSPRPTTGSPPRTPAGSCSASASATPRRRASTAARTTRSSTTSTSSTPRACPSRTGRSPRSGRRCWRSPRSAPPGAHPYLTTPEHTRLAREILGDGPLLAPEQKVVRRHRPRGRPRAGPPGRRPALPAPAQLHVEPAAARLDRRRPRRRRQRRADRRAGRARRRRHRRRRAHRAPRRRRGPRLPAAADRPGADPLPTWRPSPRRSELR